MRAQPVTKWSIHACGDPFAAPELHSRHVVGVWPDGHRRISSETVETVGPRTVRTAKGSLYELSGDPDPAYAAHMAKAGRPLNLENPLAFRKDGGAQ